MGNRFEDFHRPDYTRCDAIDIADLSGDLHTLVREYIARNIFQARSEIDIFLTILNDVHEFLQHPEDEGIQRPYAMEEARGRIQEEMQSRLRFSIDIYNHPNLMGMHTTARSIFNCLNSSKHP